MSRTIINVGAVIDATNQINSAKSSVGSAKSSFTQTKNSVDGKIQNRSNIRNRLNTVQSQLSSIDSQIGKIRSMVQSGANLYRSTDDRVESWRDEIKNHVGTRTIGQATGVWASYFDDYKLKPLAATGTESYAFANNGKSFELTASETDDLIERIAASEGVPKENILADINAGLEPAQKWLSKADEVLGKTEKWARTATGATDLVFTQVGGKVILSGFSRSGFLNGMVKTFHKGVGIGTRYNSSTLLSTPVLGPLYAINKVAEGVEVVAGVAEGTVKVLQVGSKIVDVLNDDSKSATEKACDATAIGITSVTAAALDVAAPFAGKAVTTAVTTAVTSLIPIPGVNVVAGVVAGVAVKSVISTASDVITSEAVVSQVSDSVGNVGSAIASGMEAVSDAGKALLESKNAGEAVTNAAKLVGTAVVANANAVGTAAIETVKVVGTVAVETVKTVGNNIVEAGESVVNWFKSW